MKLSACVCLPIFLFCSIATGMSLNPGLYKPAKVESCPFLVSPNSDNSKVILEVSNRGFREKKIEEACERVWRIVGLTKFDVESATGVYTAEMVVSKGRAYPRATVKLEILTPRSFKLSIPQEEETIERIFVLFPEEEKTLKKKTERS